MPTSRTSPARPDGRRHPVPARPDRRPVPARPGRRSSRWARATAAVVALVVPLAAVTLGAAPAHAAPPLGGPFTGVLRADDGSTAGVSATFAPAAGTASGTLFVAPGAILKDCYGAGPRDIGA